VAIKGLNPLDVPVSPTNIGKLKTDVRGAYSKDNAYKMEFTRGHMERTSKMTDPFKNNSLSFESTRNMNLSRNLFKNKLKTAKMKNETI
jgi:hypothetical protein